MKFLPSSKSGDGGSRCPCSDGVVGASDGVGSGGRVGDHFGDGVGVEVVVVMVFVVIVVVEMLELMVL